MVIERGAYRRCEGARGTFDSGITQNRVKESAVDRSLKSSKNRPKKQDLQSESNHVHDRVRDESNRSDR